MMESSMMDAGVTDRNGLVVVIAMISVDIDIVVLSLDESSVEL